MISTSTEWTLGGSIFDADYKEALKLKKKLTRKFAGSPLEDAIPGRVVTNDFGEVYCVKNECYTFLKKPTPEKSRSALLSDLKLVHGIGPVTEGILKKQGYPTIEDLIGMPRWGESAKEILKMIDGSDVKSLQRWLWRYLPKSHPQLHYLAGFCDFEDFIIMDIETLGLFGRPIVLLGIAKPNRRGICTNQYLLRDISDEPGALWQFVSQLNENSTLITFNGRSFDIPYIRERLGFYGIEAEIEKAHFDILHFSRRAWRQRLPDCRLGTIEKFLGIEREIDIPGGLVPDFYQTYLEKQNVGPLVAIVEHNKQDLLTLAELFSKLYEEWSI